MTTGADSAAGGSAVADGVLRATDGPLPPRASCAPWFGPAASGAGADIYGLVDDIFPICRSISGDGVRETMRLISERTVPFSIREVPTGTPVFDWTIPREWNITDAYIKTLDGRRIVDFKANNLHVVSSSAPVNARMSLEQLRPHLFTLPERPDLIPYRVTHYREDWGFCLADRVAQSMTDTEYDVCIVSTLSDGALSYGEYLHRGESEDEVLLSAHVCHPSMANDNASAVALLAQLALRLRQVATRLSYRFVLAPGTIGAIAWLAQNEANLHRIKHGLVVSCVGDASPPIYNRTRNGHHAIDRAMSAATTSAGGTVAEFSPCLTDERQYASPAFNLPVGAFLRGSWDTFPEYHTSADTLAVIDPVHLQGSFDVIWSALSILENDRMLVGTVQKGEPQLGRWGAYEAIADLNLGKAGHTTMLWLINCCDGRHTLLDIAQRSGLPFGSLCQVAERLERIGLLK